MALLNSFVNSSIVQFIVRNFYTRRVALTLIICAVISAVGTYIAIKNSDPIGPDPKLVVNLLLVNLVFLLALSIIVSIKVVNLWSERVKGSVGSRMQITIVVMFSLISAIPTLIITTFSIMFFNFGVQTWFNQKVGTAIEESVAVANAYLAEHKEIIKADALAMSYDLNRDTNLMYSDQTRFNKIVEAQASLRSLTEAIVFKRNKILARTALSFSLIFELEKITKEMLDKANNGEVVIITDEDEDRVRALVRLDGTLNTYLLVGRLVDSKIIGHTESTKGAANQYKKLKTDISKIQIRFYIVFIGVAFLILLSSVWFGMVVAAELVNPIIKLVKATEKVKSGDLNARVHEGPENDEISTLARSFNMMTEQLQKQRGQLIEINRQIDERRRFTEAVLSGVSTGVMSLDKDGNVNLINRSATKFFTTSPEDLYNKHYSSVLPEIKEVILAAEQNKDQISQAEISVSINNIKYFLIARVAVEKSNEAITGYVITFDDITELKSAERNKAWSDVARRIAHEIKNPLTPIHLAAERLRKKYLPEISSQPENFTKYIDTIISHVRDIGQMVEEFAEYARMPAPSFAEHDLRKIVRDAVFMQSTVNNEIEYKTNFPESAATFTCDERQLSQALLNILKNAAEAVKTKISTEENFKGKISLELKNNDEEIELIVKDNGTGFDKTIIDRLTEPYITTKEKGTGLGLSIVKKIIDDHHGKIILKNLDVGACVLLQFKNKKST